MSRGGRPDLQKKEQNRQEARAGGALIGAGGGVIIFSLLLQNLNFGRSALATVFLVVGLQLVQPWLDGAIRRVRRAGYWTVALGAISALVFTPFIVDTYPLFVPIVGGLYTSLRVLISDYAYWAEVDSRQYNR
jgi:hypothetical protein